MLPVQDPPLPALQAPLPFAHREPFASHFQRLAALPDARAALQRLVVHLDADLDGPQRVALCHALWSCRQRLDDAGRAAVAATLDGRHAHRLALPDGDWPDPALITHLAVTAPAAAHADFVGALLAHHGLDPLSAPASVPAPLLMCAVQAALRGAGERLGADRIRQLQAAALHAAGDDATLLPQGLAVLFDLALHAADDTTATAVLAELLHHGHARALDTDRVRAWLDGCAFSDDEDGQRPLLMAAAWQRQWLLPATWADRRHLAALHGALQRPAPRRRLEQLATQLDQLAAGGMPVAVRTAPPRREALRALSALDGGWALVDRGGDAAPALQPMLEPGTLAPAAIAAVWRASARWHAARGDREGQALALARARRFHATPALRAALGALLPAPVPPLGADWNAEEGWWQALAADTASPWRDLARYQLATLYTEGLLEPRPPLRCQRLPQAQALWQQLAAVPRYARAAAAALSHPLQTVLRPALCRDGGVEHLWFHTPGATQVMVVFSCVATHHGYAEVTALKGRLSGHHLMFVRCPAKDWYTDGTYDAVHALLKARVADRFDADDVVCWYGSMGGHGALKFALAFGWRAITFNPQTDLDLWAAFRPRERHLLWGAQRHAALAEGRPGAWQRTPLYLACGSATADREALSVVIAQLRRCAHASAIIEKFDDDNHAGLMARISGGPVAPVLARIDQRLQLLRADTLLPGMQAVPADGAAAWWDRLDAARVLKLELQLREGRLWWQPSDACGTRP